MDMNRNRSRRLLIIGFFFVTFNILAFVIPYQRNAIFWTAFFFSNISILAMVVVDWVAFRNSDTVKRMFMGMPIIKLAYPCLITLLTVCKIFVIIGSFVSIPTWMLAVPCILIISFGTISIFKADWGREVIEQLEEKHLASTEFMMGFRANLDALIPRVSDPPLRTKIEGLAKIAKRSDPVSDDTLAEIEYEMELKFEQLKTFVLANVFNEAITIADEISHLLNERNVKCRLSKRKYQQ